MNVGFLNAGYGNIVMASRIIAIVGTGSAPIKRILEKAEEEGRLVNISQGRKWRSAIIMDSNHVIVSALQPETMANRFFSDKASIEEENELNKE